jgi:hypothetical protein
VFLGGAFEPLCNLPAGLGSVIAYTLGTRSNREVSWRHKLR